MNAKPIQLSPSMMCADFLSLSEELDIMIEHKVAMLHIDIMDGTYVPNFTMGPDMAYSMRDYSNIPLDFHLMIEDVDRNLDLFTKDAHNTVTFHPETSRHPVRTIQMIKEKQCKAGLAIDPGMPLENVKHLLPLVDMVCVMTVNPGFAGQKLLNFCLGKIKELRDWKRQNNCNFNIEVDGNVSWENIPLMIASGANVLVLGTSSIFMKALPRKDAFKKLDALLAGKQTGIFN